MATFYSIEDTAIRNTAPQLQGDANFYGGKLRRIRKTFALAAQAAADILDLGKLPEGGQFAYGLITSSVSLGAATLAIGIAGSTGKYRTAAVHTTVDQPVLFGNAAAKDDAALAASEALQALIAAAALPGAGILCIDIFYTTRS